MEQTREEKENDKEQIINTQKIQRIKIPMPSNMIIQEEEIKETKKEEQADIIQIRRRPVNKKQIREESEQKNQEDEEMINFENEKVELKIKVNPETNKLTKSPEKPIKSALKKKPENKQEKEYNDHRKNKINFKEDTVHQYLKEEPTDKRIDPKEVTGVKYQDGVLTEFSSITTKDLPINTIIKEDNHRRHIYDLSEDRINEMCIAGNVFYVLTSYNDNKAMEKLTEAAARNIYNAWDPTYTTQLTEALDKIKNNHEYATEITNNIIQTGSSISNQLEQQIKVVFKRMVHTDNGKIITTQKIKGLSVQNTFHENHSFYTIQASSMLVSEVIRGASTKFTIGSVDSDFLSHAHKYPLNDETHQDIQNTLKTFTLDSGSPLSFITRLQKLKDVRNRMYNKIDMKIQTTETLGKLLASMSELGLYYDDFNFQKFYLMEQYDIIPEIYQEEFFEDTLGLKDKYDKHMWHFPQPATTRNIHIGIFGIRTTNSAYIDFFPSEKVGRYFRQKYPTLLNIELPTNPSEMKLTTIITTDNKQYKPASYNLSSRGLIFANKQLKRSETIDAEMARAFDIINLLKSKFTKTVITSKKGLHLEHQIRNLITQNTTSILKAIESVMETFDVDFSDISMKTKFEVHKKEKPARLFFPANTSSNIIPQYVLNIAMNSRNRTPNMLYGISTGKSDMTQKIKEILSDADTQRYYSYCDNFYLTGDGQYFSCDVESMEANHTADMMTIFSIMAGCSVLKESEWLVWITYSILTNYVYSFKKAYFSIANDILAYFPISIMPSGTAGTSFYNDMFTDFIGYISEGMEYISGDTVSDSFTLLLSELGVQWKLEKQIKTSEITKGIVPIDMLGMSAIVFSTDNWSLVPILDKERIIKSLCFNQSTSKNELVRKIISLYKVKCMIRNGITYWKDLGSCAYDYLIMLSNEIMADLESNPAETAACLIDENLSLEQLESEFSAPIDYTWGMYVSTHTPYTSLEQVYHIIKQDGNMKGIEITNQLSPIAKYILAGLTDFSQGIKVSSFLRDEMTLAYRTKMMAIEKMKSRKTKKTLSFNDYLNGDSYTIYLKDNNTATDFINSLVGYEGYTEFIIRLLSKNPSKISKSLNNICDIYIKTLKYFIFKGDKTDFLIQFDTEVNHPKYNKLWKNFVEKIRKGVTSDVAGNQKKQANFIELLKTKKIQIELVEDVEIPYYRFSIPQVFAFNTAYYEEFKKDPTIETTLARYLSKVLQGLFENFNEDIADGFYFGSTTTKTYSIKSNITDPTYMLYTIYKNICAKTPEEVSFKRFLVLMRKNTMRRIEIKEYSNSLQSVSFENMKKIMTTQYNITTVSSSDYRTAIIRLRDSFIKTHHLSQDSRLKDIYSFLCYGLHMEFNQLIRHKKWIANLILTYLDGGTMFHQLIALYFLHSLERYDSDKLLKLATLMRERLDVEYELLRKIPITDPDLQFQKPPSHNRIKFKKDPISLVRELTIDDLKIYLKKLKKDTDQQRKLIADDERQKQEMEDQIEQINDDIARENLRAHIVRKNQDGLDMDVEDLENPPEGYEVMKTKNMLIEEEMWANRGKSELKLPKNLQEVQNIRIEQPIIIPNTIKDQPAIQIIKKKSKTKTKKPAFAMSYNIHVLPNKDVDGFDLLVGSSLITIPYKCFNCGSLYIAGVSKDNIQKEHFLHDTQYIQRKSKVVRDLNFFPTNLKYYIAFGLSQSSLDNIDPNKNILINISNSSFFLELDPMSSSIYPMTTYSFTSVPLCFPNLISSALEFQGNLGPEQFNFFVGINKNKIKTNISEITLAIEQQKLKSLKEWYDITLRSILSRDITIKVSDQVGLEIKPGIEFNDEIDLLNKEHTKIINDVLMYFYESKLEKYPVKKVDCNLTMLLPEINSKKSYDFIILNSEFHSNKESLIPIYLHVALPTEKGFDRYIVFPDEFVYTKLSQPSNIKGVMGYYNAMVAKKKEVPLWLKVFTIVSKLKPKDIVDTHIKEQIIFEFCRLYKTKIMENLEEFGYTSMNIIDLKNIIHKTKIIMNPNLSNSDVIIYEKLGFSYKAKLRNIMIESVKTKGYDLEIARTIQYIKDNNITHYSQIKILRASLAYAMSSNYRSKTLEPTHKNKPTKVKEQKILLKKKVPRELVAGIAIRKILNDFWYFNVRLSVYQENSLIIMGYLFSDDRGLNYSFYLHINGDIVNKKCNYCKKEENVIYIKGTNLTDLDGDSNIVPFFNDDSFSCYLCFRKIFRTWYFIKKKDKNDNTIYIPEKDSQVCFKEPPIKNWIYTDLHDYIISDLTAWLDEIKDQEGLIYETSFNDYIDNIRFIGKTLKPIIDQDIPFKEKLKNKADTLINEEKNEALSDTSVSASSDRSFSF